MAHLPMLRGKCSRTLLMMPTWTYVKSKDGLYVNMFVGSRIHVGKVAGTEVEVVQKTDYPWHGAVAITINPEEAKTFLGLCAHSRTGPPASFTRNLPRCRA